MSALAPNGSEPGTAPDIVTNGDPRDGRTGPLPAG